MPHTDPTTRRPIRTAPRPVAVVAGLVLLLALAGCGSDGGSSGDQTPTTPAPSTTAVAGSGASDAAAVKVADSDLGPILVDGDGHTLYAFTPDSASASTCNEGCASTWPPLVTSGEPEADGVDETDLTTITRDDGTTQVVVDGHPLYTYAADAEPGDTSGQGVGGAWYVVDAEGKLVKGSGADSGTDSTPSGDGGY